MYKNIVVPIDPKKLSKKAMLHIFNFANITGAHIDFVHASSKIFDDDEEVMLRISLDKFHEEENKVIETELHELETFIQTEDLNEMAEAVSWAVSIISAHDDAGGSILKFGEKHNVDLYILSIPQHSSKWQILIGNIKEWVIHNAECPVLVVHR